MFGISFSEIVLVAMVALIVVGPQKLPGLLLGLGRGIAKIRRMTDNVRMQTGIDEILREEGIDGVRELRNLLRGEVAAARARNTDPFDDAVEIDESQEYPPEGVDAAGALADDLVSSDAEPAVTPLEAHTVPGAPAGNVEAEPSKGSEP